MAAEKPFLPVENPTLPFWLTERSPLDAHRSTPNLPDESEIVIIGAGYAGVSLAYHLLTSPSYSTKRPSITILEARTVCSGATGRNGKVLSVSHQLVDS
jgi:ribulose 1,5-bisphosphate synthetase/thiazole synthase